MSWYNTPLEKRKEIAKDIYAKKDKQKVKEDWKKYHSENKEQINKRKNEYRKSTDGKAKYKLYKAKRRALERKATIVKFSHKDYLLRMEVFGNKCYYCDGPFEHLDHAIALSKGGYHCLANFRPSCESCNLSKSSKSYKEWIKSLLKFNKDLNKEEIKKDNNNEGSNKDNN